MKSSTRSPAYEGLKQPSWAPARFVTLMLIAVACRPPAALDRGISVDVRDTTVTASRLDDGVSFDVHLTIRNSGSGPLYVVRCGEVLEKRSAEGWRLVWSEICIGQWDSNQRMVPESGSLEHVVHVSGSLATDFPRFAVDSIPGSYRIVLQLRRGSVDRNTGTGGSAVQSATQPFTVR